jgi:hypothetical protein
MEARYRFVAGRFGRSHEDSYALCGYPCCGAILCALTWEDGADPSWFVAAHASYVQRERLVWALSQHAKRSRRGGTRRPVNVHLRYDMPAAVVGARVWLKGLDGHTRRPATPLEEYAAQYAARNASSRVIASLISGVRLPTVSEDSFRDDLPFVLAPAITMVCAEHGHHSSVSYRGVEEERRRLIVQQTKRA